MAFRFLLLLLVIPAASRLEAQFSSTPDLIGSRNRSSTDNGTSENQRGPRRTNSEESDGEDRLSNDPFGDLLVDPRMGGEIDPAEIDELRIFSIGGGIAEDDDQETARSQREQVEPPAPRRIRWRSRAQYINRLGPLLKKGVARDRAADSKAIAAAQRSLRALNEPDLSVEVSSGVLVLRGTVNSDYRKRMIERFVLLEPGIRQIRNEIQVSTLPSY